LQSAQVSINLADSDFVREYRITEGDMLNIEVIGKDEFGVEARVSPRGDLQLPLLGRAQLAGKTTEEAQKYIESLLTNGYLRNPQVNVYVSDFSQFEVLVFGAVAKPGAVELSGPRRLLDVLMMAGGLADTAGTRAIIFRARSATTTPAPVFGPEPMSAAPLANAKGDDDAAMLDEPEVPTPETPRESSFDTDIPAPAPESGIEIIDLDALLYEGRTDLNVAIFPEDRINIPHAGRVFLRGNIPKPGEYPIKGGRMTLTQVIAQAGGYLPFRATDEVQIKRFSKSSDDVERLVVDVRAIIADEAPDILLADGDDIFFPTSWWRAPIADVLNFFDRLIFGFGPAMV